MTGTSRASLRNGMAKAMLRAVSRLPFQATATIVPSVAGAFGGAISSGRPLSNSAASSVERFGSCDAAPGRPTTMRSKMRPYSPTLVGGIKVSPCQPKLGAAGSGPSRHIGGGHRLLEGLRRLAQEGATGAIVEDDAAHREIGGDEAGDVGAERNTLDIAAEQARRDDRGRQHRVPCGHGPRPARGSTSWRPPFGCCSGSVAQEPRRFQHVRRGIRGDRP